MPISERIPETLDFEDYNLYYTKRLSNGKPSEVSFNKASWFHALTVADSLMKLQFETMTFAHKVSIEKASHYLQFGASRRLGSLFRSYNSFIRTVPPYRKEPLQEEEKHGLDKDLNLMYIHLRGVLDNYALIYCLLKEPYLLEKLKQNQIWFFNKKFEKESQMTICSKLKEYDKWIEDLSERRDPVAHRIPLYMVPSLLNSQETKIHNELMTQHTTFLSHHQFDLADKSFNDALSLGTYWPVFAYNPYEKSIPIYPTVPTDMANLIKIHRIVFEELKTSEVN